MAYSTGTAASASALITTVKTLSQSAGWSVSGDILSKGNCYIQLKEVTSRVEIKVGENASMTTNTGGSRKEYASYPCTYHIFTQPDSVAVILEHSGNKVAWLLFGTLDNVDPNETFGTYGLASGNPLSSYVFRHYYNDITGNYDSSVSSCVPFTPTNPSNVNSRSVLSSMDTTETKKAELMKVVGARLHSTPNSYGQQGVLTPLDLVVKRASNLYSPVGHPPYIRLVRIDHLTFGQELTLGSDVWKIFPCSLKTPAETVGTSATASMSIGIALLK